MVGPRANKTDSTRRKYPRLRRRMRLVRRDHPELEPLFDEEEAELVPCVCGEKQ